MLWRSFSFLFKRETMEGKAARRPLHFKKRLRHFLTIVAFLVEEDAKGKKKLHYFFPQTSPVTVFDLVW